MGKKKVIKQTQDEALKETAKVEAALVKTGGKTSGKQLIKGAVYITAMDSGYFKFILECEKAAVC